MTPPIHFRDMRPDDVPFIAHTWLQTYRYSEFAKQIRNSTYYSDGGHQGIVNRLIQATDVVVATLGGTIAGWVCYTEAAALHYVFVAPTFKRIGINLGTQLVQKAVEGKEVVVTHRTKAFDKLAQSMGIEVFYDPYLLMKLDEMHRRQAA